MTDEQRVMVETLGPRAGALLGLIAGAGGPRTTEELLDLARRADRSDAFAEIRADLPADAAAPFVAVSEVARAGLPALRALLERLEEFSLVDRVTFGPETLWRRTP